MLVVVGRRRRSEPHATRAWGVTVLSRDPPQVRLLLDADDAVAIET